MSTFKGPSFINATFQPLGLMTVFIRPNEDEDQSLREAALMNEGSLLKHCAHFHFLYL